MRFCGIFLICIFVIGCRPLLTQHTFMDEHTYVRIDAPVTVTHTSDGILFVLPKREFVRKIRILGEGAVQNMEIWARGSKWRPVRVINRNSASPLILPIEIFFHHLPLTFKIDAIRILDKTSIVALDQPDRFPKSQIDTVEFYTIGSKDQ